MLGRFTVRPAENGSGSFGVWDSAVSGWRATDLTEQQAHATAADLDVQYDAHGPRPATSVRRVEPAQQVQRAEWREKGQRELRWVSPNEATELVDEPGLAHLILAFANRHASPDFKASADRPASSRKQRVAV